MEVLEVARELLRNVALCDRCMGRMFASLSVGLSNKERGVAIKRALVMEYHRQIKEGSEEAKEEFRKAAPRIGSEAAALYRSLFGEELSSEPCFICGDRLEEFIEKAAEKGRELLTLTNARSFLVGVRAAKGIARAEEQLISRFSLAFAESIKREIKREVGKRIAREGLRVDFEEPEAVLLVKFPSGDAKVQLASLLLKGRYWKRGRLISQAFWPSPEGKKYYSVEEACWSILRLADGKSLSIHAAGREDVDARMLGSGRPMVIEIKEPRNREVDERGAEMAVREASRGVVEVSLSGRAKRGLVRVYKEESKLRSKVYRALVVVEEGLSEAELLRVEDQLRGALVRQRTPTRVLHRRSDVERVKRVLGIKCMLLNSTTAECLIWASGGLYVKELVSGDNGRTSPSFSSILGKRAECVELDVLFVEMPLGSE
ncbi:MAG: tRNA pseudouridine(54/55) synthase Pus10 [Acidilobaceae archaeon]|nr:tRNA pseudouridine(54/55) synthase Pus10 [Acidilobaceae archaeon]